MDPVFDHPTPRLLNTLWAAWWLLFAVLVSLLMRSDAGEVAQVERVMLTIVGALIGFLTGTIYAAAQRQVRA